MVCLSALTPDLRPDNLPDVRIRTNQGKRRAIMMNARLSRGYDSSRHLSILSLSYQLTETLTGVLAMPVKGQGTI